MLSMPMPNVDFTPPQIRERSMNKVCQRLEQANQFRENAAANKIPTRKVIDSLFDAPQNEKSLVFGAAQVLIQAIGDVLILKDRLDNGGYLNHDDLGDLYQILQETKQKVGTSAQYATGKEAIWQQRFTAQMKWGVITDLIGNIQKSSIHTYEPDEQRELLAKLNGILTQFDQLVQIQVAPDKGKPIEKDIPYAPSYVVVERNNLPNPNHDTRHEVRIYNTDGTSFEAILSPITMKVQELEISKITRTASSTAFGKRESLSLSSIQAIEFIGEEGKAPEVAEKVEQESHEPLDTRNLDDPNFIRELAKRIKL